MPIYEYECRACGHRLEKLQKVSDDLLKDCPECEKPDLQKLVSAAAFRLKGGGWYETDFKNGKKKNVMNTGESASSGDSASGDSGSSGDTGKSGSSESTSSDTSSNKKSEVATAAS